MKKFNELSESSFLKLFFAFICAAFLTAALCMPDRNTMFSGLWQILSQPAKLSANYYSIGGYAATYLNMALVGLACLGLYCLPGAVVNNVATLAFLLTVSFGAWGTHILNMWFTIAGVVVYALVKKQKPGSLVNAMLFSTGVSPIISELLVRYPGMETVGFSIPGLLLALVVGLAIGFFLPAGLSYSPNCHKGYTHYSAAIPVGMTAFVFQGVFYKTMGLQIPGAPGDMSVASQLTANIFYAVVFGICIVVSLLMGCRPKDYIALVKEPGKGVSYSAKYGNATFLMNVGVFGLFILGYYNLIGATFNAPTFGLVLGLLSTCNTGSHPRNVLPIMLGYAAASFLMGWLSGLTGGTFATPINAQAIAVGLCFATGLSPISGVFGWQYGMLAAMLHYCIVTTVPNVHGGFCLYNGGFTAAFVCIFFVPILESLVKTKAERKAAKIK